jgi:hypothetical protein
MRKNLQLDYVIRDTNLSILLPLSLRAKLFYKSMFQKVFLVLSS